MKRLQPPAPLTRRVSECRMKCGSWRVTAIDLPPSSVSFQYVFSSDVAASCASAAPATNASAAVASIDCPILASLIHASPGTPIVRPPGPTTYWTLVRCSCTKHRTMELPRTASAVVIGGGVVGCSIAYNLARRGLTDVVVVE